MSMVHYSDITVNGYAIVEASYSEQCDLGVRQLISTSKYKVWCSNQ